MKSTHKSEQMHELDDTDKKILRTLISDARLSYREIARRNKIAVSTVIDRIAKLRHNGVIDGYSILVNPDKVGYNLTAVICLQMPKGLVRKGIEEIVDLTNVHGIYETTGRYDTFVIAKFKNIEEMQTFLKDLHSKDFVKKTETHVVLKKTKEDFRVIV